MTKTIHASLSAEFLTDNTIEGWLCKYGVLSFPFDTQSGQKMYWQIQPNAFAQSVSQIKAGIYSINCNVEHETDDCTKQIGSTKTNIELDHRQAGIWFKMTLPDTQLAQDLYKNMKLGLVNGVSLEAKSTTNKKPKIKRIKDGYVKILDSLRLVGFAIVQRPRFAECQAHASYSFDIDVSDDESKSIDQDIQQHNEDLLVRTTQEYEQKINTLEAEKTELQLQIEYGQAELLKEKISHFTLSDEDKNIIKQELINTQK